MLTIFAHPKPFVGHTSVIQRNAVRSWQLLDPDVEVILLGDDTGVAETASQLALRHCGGVKRNEFGTPLVSDVFEKAQTLARHELVCYTNSDILFVPDFLTGVSQARRWRRRFLLTGRRWNIDLTEPLDFRPGWDASLTEGAHMHGKLQDVWWIDYFVFPKGLFERLPPFAIGRAAWDNWLVYHARQRKIPVVDATAVITAIHQNHDYGHVPSSRGIWRGPESDRNLELAGGRERAFSLADATHRLSPRGVLPRLSLQPIRRALGLTSDLGPAARLRRFLRRRPAE
jgi:hypothetical protein